MTDSDKHLSFYVISDKTLSRLSLESVQKLNTFCGAKYPNDIQIAKMTNVCHNLKSIKTASSKTNDRHDKLFIPFS